MKALQLLLGIHSGRRLKLGVLLGCAGLLLAFGLAARAAAAQGEPHAPAPGHIELVAEQGGAPLELVREGEIFSAPVRIHNRGSGPLTVTRIEPRHGPEDPRLPPGVSIAPAGKLPLVIAPGASERAVVRWDGTQARARELYGHVLVYWGAGEGAQAAARPVAIGIHAEKPNALGVLGAHVLSLMVFLPLLGLVLAFVAHLVRYKKDEHIKWLSVGLMGVEVLLALWVYARFDPGLLPAHGNDGYQLIERGVWVGSLGAEYFVGIDGISVTMLLLTALVSFAAALASFSVDKQLKGYWAMFNLLVTGMMGTFVALDLILFFVFWELMLLPMYFLIGIWGGPRRVYAAIKFFLYTLAGSVLMLLAFIFFYLWFAEAATAGGAAQAYTYLCDGQLVTRSLAIPELARIPWAASGLQILSLPAHLVCWVLLFIGFAIKIPMFPFHTWLPDAHVEAPTAISVILAGVLLKMGTYGILRFNFAILPEATRWAALAMAVFGVINIVYGAFNAMAQSDLKKLVANSSISHMGFCLLGLGALTPLGIEACLVQMVSHGLITSMLFTLVGVVYDRVHTRDLDRFGGLASEMPLYTAFTGFAFMASLGLPGLSGFWGEALTFIGAFPRYRVLTIVAASSVIITAAYHLWALQRMFLGKFRESWRQSKYLQPFGGKFPEMNLREVCSLAPLALLVLLLGFWPRPLLHLIDEGSLAVHRLVDPAGPRQISLLPAGGESVALASAPGRRAAPGERRVVR
ncbi:MAG: NADH-quinone oxidoreductase subunit M [Deltaproteobacteria bacterium]|nr:NADH-quinone oxidoreductase subunit M [Deltaproteobacteria bacterium]